MSHLYRDDSNLRGRICELGQSLFDRGLTAGSSGNISVRLQEGFLVTATNSSLGRLDPDRLSLLDSEGRLVSGDPPSKEAPLHLAAYAARPGAGAVVHLHCPFSAALSMREQADPESMIPPLTPYFVMRVGKLPLLPYFAPGDNAAAAQVLSAMTDHRAVMLANHGPIVTGTTLEDAVNAAEELEATARLMVMNSGQAVRSLTGAQLAELGDRFGAHWDRPRGRSSKPEPGLSN